MGTYDTVHAGDVCIQVKCLGRTLHHFVPGDEAELHRPCTDEEFIDLVRSVGRYRAADHLYTGIPTGPDSFCVLLGAGVLVVEAGVIIGWEPWPRPDLPLVGNDGLPVEDIAAPGVHVGYCGDPRRPAGLFLLVSDSTDPDSTDPALVADDPEDDDPHFGADWLQRLTAPEGPCSRCAEVRARRRAVDR